MSKTITAPIAEDNFTECKSSGFTYNPPLNLRIAAAKAEAYNFATQAETEAFIQGWIGHADDSAITS